MIFLAAILVLHTVDGREIDVNPAQITSMREAKEEDSPDRAFTGKVKCMINLTDGKFVTVVEECSDIRMRHADPNRPPAK